MSQPKRSEFFTPGRRYKDSRGGTFTIDASGCMIRDDKTKLSKAEKKARKRDRQRQRNTV